MRQLVWVLYSLSPIFEPRGIDEGNGVAQHVLQMCMIMIGCTGSG